MKKFTGSDFRAWRAKNDLTQQQSADVIGVTIHAVRSWEQGLRQPPKHIVLLINRLKPEDYPADAGSAGNRPVAVATKNKRKSSV